MDGAAGAGPATEPTPRERQSLLVVCLGDLFRYASSKGYALTLGEGFIQNPRKTREGAVVEDGVHMRQSLHYERLAQDLNLFVGGQYIRDGEHLAWIELGTYWEQLSPLCRSGIRFKDANHFSISPDGKRA